MQNPNKTVSDRPVRMLREIFALHRALAVLDPFENCLVQQLNGLGWF